MRTLSYPVLAAFAGAAALCLTGVRPAAADTVTFSLLDIGTFAGYTEANTGQTYAGSGFVGYYGPASGSDNRFVHLFGLESNDYSRVALEQDITSLSGATINSASLLFDLVDSGGGTQTVTATSFDATGALGYQFAIPAAPLGQTMGTVTGNGGNSLDVTNLFADRVASGATYFGLHLAGTTPGRYVYTYTDAFGSDRARVSLNVNYTPNAPAPAGVVPEPGTLALLGTGGLSGLAGMVRVRRRRSA